MDCVEAIMTCLSGQDKKSYTAVPFDEKSIVTTQPTPYSDEPAQQFIEILRTADESGDELEKRLKSVVSTTGWTEHLAERTLHGIEKIIKDGAKIASAMRNAVLSAESMALEFAQEHPYYTVLIAAGTLVALGVLVMLAPWVLEALGFTLRGPRLGKSRRPAPLVARKTDR